MGELLRLSTRKPGKKPPSISLESILLKASMTKTKKRRERVPLAKSSRATKEAMGAAVDQDREASRGNTCRNPLPPFRAKTCTPQNIVKEVPINMVKIDC
jgi:hypothetical protein